MPFVGAAGLVGPEPPHYSGGSITSRPYQKNVPLLQTLCVVVCARLMWFMETDIRELAIGGVLVVWSIESLR
jgi:hypothetical protein